MGRVIVVVGLAVVLAGCSGAVLGPQGILGGGRPTSIECEGKATIMYGPSPAHIDCPDKFRLKINVQ